MARNIGPKCRLCRREGRKLFLKGERCYTEKCAVKKRGSNYPPGVHTWRRSRVSEYGRQLRERQKLKRIFGMLERQFRAMFAEANRTTGNTGETLLRLALRRLDNVCRCSGFGLGPASARQLITHGHVRVNGKKVDRPSYLVRLNDVITVAGQDRIRKLVAANLERSRAFMAAAPSWLDVNAEALSARVAALPGREEFPCVAEIDKQPVGLDEQLIVEGCAK